MTVDVEPGGHAEPGGIAALPPLRRTERAGHTGDQVRDLLEEAILAGVLAPGTHLNAEALAKQLGVSHIPVREALRSLHAAGWIDTRPHLGAFVRARTEQELADLFELRLQLESHAAVLAAERRTSAQLDQLDGILSRQRAAVDPFALGEINAVFHVAVAECAQNQFLIDFVRTLSIRTRFYFATVAPQRRDDSLREHGEMVDAIRRRDAATAGRIAHDHVFHTRADVLRALRGTPATAPG
ncbi:GntR family transcriptional regulator [Micromonospora sp. Llam0]|uniref:GntR family transcriptional regulator n=1 Tax=Micromonospora sp. Llam0 TaxID=2485143 RepID=UPI000F47A29B|nr:GntR family transcriptional regulator [Micromonospora sp. Llam0]ROO58704.1 GntR family transcriptional regulator [Micromonospora sp. Llam0]